MADLVLYHAVPSRSMVVHWMLEELGEPYELVMLDLAEDEHKQPEYLEVNAMGRVPSLEHGDTIITETAAICAYLADAFPGAGLAVPADSPLRGEYLRWLFFGPATAEPSILWAVLGETVSAVETPPFADLETVAATLRDTIGDREFIVGDRFTAADVVIGSTLFWGLNLMPVIPRHPELTSYWERLSERPAWKRSNDADEALMAR